MAETIKGKGIVWGANGITFTAGIVTTTSGHATQSARLVRDSDVAEVRNGDGECITKVFYNHKKTLSVTVVPTGTTIAAAVTSGDAWAPQAGTVVTAVDADGTILDEDYNVLSSTQNRTNDGAMTADLELEMYEANDVTTAAAAS